MSLLLMLWLKKLNFMETAKLEMELMKALDAGEDLDAKLADQKQLAESTGDEEQAVCPSTNSTLSPTVQWRSSAEGPFSW